MNKNVFFGQNDLRFYYLRYKDSTYYSWFLLIVTIVVCLLITFFVIIPQMERYFSIREQVINLRSKVHILNDNINFMNNLDKSELNSQLQVSSRALPPEEDFSGVLNALADASVRSNVTLGDYSFSLISNNPVQSDSSIGLSISVGGNLDEVKAFLKNLVAELPISQIISIKNSQKSTNINLSFEYKSLPKVVFNEEESITPLTDADKQLLNTLSSWQIPNIPSVINSGSSSAVPLFE